MVESSGAVGLKGTIPGSIGTGTPDPAPAAAPEAPVAKAPATAPPVEDVLVGAAPVDVTKSKAPRAVKPLDALEVPSVFPLDDLGSIKTTSPAGQVFRLDGGFLDALRLQVRRFVAKDGQPGYSIDFKLTGPARTEFRDRLQKLGAGSSSFVFHAGKPEERDGNVVIVRDGNEMSISGSSYATHGAPDTGSAPMNAAMLSGDGWKLEYLPQDAMLACRGTVRIELTGDDKKCSAALKDIIKKTGLQSAFAPPTANSLKRYAMLKLLWRIDPAKAKEISRSVPSLSDLKISALETALAELGVPKERIDGLRYEHVCPGHFAVMDPEEVVAMKSAGLHYAYSTVDQVDHVLSILKSGQKATVTRWADGAIIQGMSSQADVRTGGAQGVFSRLVVEGCGEKTWLGRRYKIVLRPELLARTDVWGWPSDYYGRAWDLTPANFGAKLVQSVVASEKSNGSYGTANEIISPFGNGPDFIACVVATNETDRKNLIDFLNKEGWKPADGRTVEEFVKLETKMRLDLVPPPAAPPPVSAAVGKKP